MRLKLETEGVQCCYAPQVEGELKEKKKLWSQLDEAMQSNHRVWCVLIGADFNGHVEAGSRGDVEVMSRFDIQDRNAGGQRVGAFAKH